LRRGGKRRNVVSTSETNGETYCGKNKKCLKIGSRTGRKEGHLFAKECGHYGAGGKGNGKIKGEELGQKKEGRTFREYLGRKRKQARTGAQNS